MSFTGSVVKQTYHRISLSNKKKKLIHAATWMNLKGMLDEKSEFQKVWFHLYNF